MAGITIDHRPEQGREHEKYTNDTEDDRAMCEEQYLDQDENHSENKERNDLPAGEAGQVMPKEKEGETNHRDYSWPRHARYFKFQIRTENSSQQKQWRKGCDPKRELLETSRFDRDFVSFETGFFDEISHRIGDALCE